MKKSDVIEKYGKERCKEMRLFLLKLSRYYGFPYFDENIYDFTVDLSKFTSEDLEASFTVLKDREGNFQLKFNEIYNACNDSRNARLRKEEEEKPEEETKSLPMPEIVKQNIRKILNKSNNFLKKDE